MYMKITYYHTLYKREVTEIVCGEVKFFGTYVTFKSSGHGERVETQYIKSIEALEA